ncbi:HTH-type transcriptional repressor Bm3R1 [Raoultella ornithinolytica]|nr:HTH-type transcriptional repressor Bm3R1 [Raoultella ornithinolytica]
MARPKSEDKKQALLEAATAAFAQSGIAASTSAIARSAGVAEGTLFRYFATKDELLNELYLSIKSGLVKAMVSGLTPNEKTAERERPQYLGQLYRLEYSPPDGAQGDSPDGAQRTHHR